MKEIYKKIKLVKVSDLISPFIFLIMLFPSLIFKIINKLKHRRLWLICEDGYTARDNGYFFYKYIKEKHPNDFCFYVIDKKNKQYEKVKQYKDVIQFKSLRHWLYYLSAEYNISNHKHGNPCQSFFYIIHVILKLYNNRVFLQHGITINDSPWIYYKNTHFRYFICGAEEEYKYVKEKFGYPKENVVYTGFARYDGLNKNKIKSKQILIMPTWRNWFGGNYFTKKEFLNSEYYKKWNSLLNNKKLISYCEKNDYKILFYPHQHVQKFIKCFNTTSKNIKIIDISQYEIQQALKESEILITDYSSVFMDFSYMQKKSIYYQFDLEKYRKYQLQEGYFDYKNGFGPVYYNEIDLVNGLIELCENNISDIYIKRMKSFFKIRDNHNCDRIYEILKNRK